MEKVEQIDRYDDFGVQVEKIVEDLGASKFLKFAIKFDDGREYVYQVPSFLEAFDARTRSLTELIKLTLKNTHPMNKKTPALDENYLNSNRTEGHDFWLPILLDCL